jgi:toxin ParE1/3/4
MGKVIWSEKASANLEAIHQYIARDSLLYATRFIKTLISHPQFLQNMPFAGRIVPEFNDPKIRELIFRNYRLVYLVEANKDVTMLAVVQGNKLLEDLYEK